MGYALVRVAVDWRRCGLTRAVPKTVLVTPGLVAIYLAGWPEDPRSREALDRGLRWAAGEINATVALLGRRFADPADSSVEAFEALDYLVEHVARAGGAVPEQLWQVSLDEARPSEWMGLGYAAYRSTNLAVAEQAFGKAAEAGDGEAMTHLGVLLQRRGRSEEAEAWYRRAANAGHAEAGGREVMTHLGVLLQRRGRLEEAEAWYRRAAKARDREAMTHLGVLLQRRGGRRRPRPGTAERLVPATGRRCTGSGCCCSSGGGWRRPRRGTGEWPRPATAGRCTISGCCWGCGVSSVRPRRGVAGPPRAAISRRCSAWGAACAVGQVG